MRKVFAMAILAALLIGALTATGWASAAGRAAKPAGQEVEDQNLAAKAGLTADQATAAALGANPGAQVVQVQLEDENGTVVYGVELSVGGKSLDVKVDAQNGKVLASQADDGPEKGEAAGSEADAD